MNRTPLRSTVLMLVAVGTASGISLHPFSSWDDLTQKSADIVVARCTATSTIGTPIINGMIWSEIQVLTVLKGNTKPVASNMVSQYRPHQGQQFLMFATYQSDQPRAAYNAAESYRVVPIHAYFQISRLTAKPLVEQIRIVLRSGLDDVHKELERGAEEKNRLEQALTQ